MHHKCESFNQVDNHKKFFNSLKQNKKDLHTQIKKWSLLFLPKYFIYLFSHGVVSNEFPSSDNCSNSILSRTVLLNFSSKSLCFKWGKKNLLIYIIIYSFHPNVANTNELFYFVWRTQTNYVVLCNVSSFNSEKKLYLKSPSTVHLT